MKCFKITNSLSLRELRQSDAVDIFESLDKQREYFGRWLPFVETTRSVEDSVLFVAMALQSPELIFTLRLEDKFIGVVGFKETNLAGTCTEIGYWMREEHQGKGYMTAAVSELIRFAMEEEGIGEVFIKCASGNRKSRNIPLRLGMTLRGIEPGGEMITEGIFRDIEVYSLRKPEKGKGL